MDITEHTEKVAERLKVVASGKATVQLDWENVIYTSWNNSFWIEIPKEENI